MLMLLLSEFSSLCCAHNLIVTLSAVGMQSIAIGVSVCQSVVYVMFSHHGATGPESITRMFH